MPPQLALIIVLIFIGCAIYIEHRRTENISGAVWIIAIWILYSGSKGLGFFLNIHTTIEAGSLPDRYFLLALGIVSLIILFRRHFPLAASLKNNLLAVMILIYSLLSVLWSRDPGISFRRWGREVVTLSIALLLCSDKCPINTLTSAIKKAIYAALLLSILLIKYYPAYGRSYGIWSGELMWEGLASQKNGLALICALSILFLIWSLEQDLKNRKQPSLRLSILIDVSMILLALYLILGPRRTFTYSATSFLSLLVGLIFLFGLKLTVNYGINVSKKTTMVAIIIIALGISMPFSGKIPSQSLPKMFNRSETLTDRTFIWTALLPYAKQHILFGHGFGGFWTTPLRNEIASHAHNGYLETILNLGVIGLILLVIFLISIIVKLTFFILENFDYIPFLAIIFMYLVHNISEATLGDFQSITGSIILMTSFLVNMEQPLERP